MDTGIKGIIVLVMLLLGALGASFYQIFTPSITASFSSSADAFVYSDMPTLNTGSYTTVQASIDWDKATYRYIYAMFDISSIPSYAQVTDVRLQVYFDYITPTTQGSDYKIVWAETNWAESTITWSSQPSTGMPGAYETQLFDGPGQKAGYFTWRVQDSKDRLMTHLKSDGKMAYVIFPNTAYKLASYHLVQMRTKEYGGGFEPKLYVDYSIPSYTLAVSVKDSDGAAVQGAAVTSPFSGTTGSSGLSSSPVEAGSKTISVSYQDLTYTKTTLLDADKTVEVIVPKYTLTIKVIDPSGNPLSEAVIISPVTGKTDSNGIFSTNLRAGTYTVTAAVGTEQATTPVSLTTTKTVTLTITPGYSIDFIVKDQVGNGLPAKVTFDGVSITCDRYGLSTKTKISKTSLAITAEIRVGTETYSTTETISITKSMTKTITITRRFFWRFYINYTDGTAATGRITATSTKETLTIPVTNGYGEAYLIDASYTFTFEASPGVALKTATITNDGDFYATLTKATATTPSTTMSSETTQIPTSAPTSPTATPEVPWILIPSVYIYALLGVLVFGFIIAVVVRARRPSK